MKTEKESRTLRVLKNIFKIRYWLDYDRVKGFTDYLLSGIKKMFIPSQKEQIESFNDAMKRLNISEAQIEQREIGLWRLSMLMLVIAFGIFLYVIYHLLYGTWQASMLSFVVMLITLVMAFRYHFWYFQIKERTLGLTLKDWYTKGLKGK